MDLGEVRKYSNSCFLGGQKCCACASRAAFHLRQILRRRRRLEAQAAKATGKEARRIRAEIEELSDSDDRNSSSSGSDSDFDYAFQTDEEEDDVDQERADSSGKLVHQTTVAAQPHHADGDFT
eukprot:SAG31_NODE_3803_length_3868_cov_6.379146_2_plen_123_part_00